MSTREHQQLDQLIEAVQASSKYRSISIDFVSYIGTQELARRHNLNDAIKATNNKVDIMDFLNESMSLLQVHGYTQACDVIRYCPTQRVDLAFMLKTLPCLEQVDKSAGLRLLEMINADHLVVSFPSHSLGGSRKGMVTHYEARFNELVTNKHWSIRRFSFATELVFLIRK